MNPLYVSLNCIKGLYDIIMNPLYVGINCLKWDVRYNCESTVYQF